MKQHQTVEASELGLPPGSFPETLCDGYWLRCGQALNYRNNEVLAVYYSHGDETLEVLND
jgi:hypothetical protein